MDFESAKKIIDDVYSKIDGYSTSFKVRKKISYTDKTLTYGEILLDSFFNILKSVEPKENEVFYDLGSGVGKAVFAAHMLFPIKKSVGIELIPDIYLEAIKTVNNFKEKYHKQLFNINEKRKIDFINKNIFDADFSDGDVIFFHATCFPDQLMVPVSKKIGSVKSGSRVIIITRCLYSDKFILQRSETHQMGWGQALVNYYIKK